MMITDTETNNFSIIEQTWRFAQHAMGAGTLRRKGVKLVRKYRENVSSNMSKSLEA